MSNKAIAELSADASLLISEISRKKPGDVITWKWMSEIVGWNLQEKNGVMQTVKNRLLRDYRYVLGTIHGEGYKILTDAEVVEGEAARDRAMRAKAAKRTKRKLQAVELSNLDDVQKQRCFAEVTAAHLAIESSKETSVKRLESSINGAGAPLALNKALEAIKKNL